MSMRPVASSAKQRCVYARQAGILDERGFAGIGIDGEHRNIVFPAAIHFLAIALHRPVATIGGKMGPAIGVDTNGTRHLPWAHICRVQQHGLSEQRGRRQAFANNGVHLKFVLQFRHDEDPWPGGMDIQMPRCVAEAPLWRYNVHQLQYAIVERIDQQRPRFVDLPGLLGNCRVPPESDVDGWQHPNLMRNNRGAPVMRLHHRLADTPIFLQRVGRDRAGLVVSGDCLLPRAIHRDVERAR